jgi:inhibitor of cysteine peptidase
MMRTLLLTLAFLAASCAPSPDGGGEAPGASDALPAPTPEDVAVRIGRGQAGQTIEVALHERFAVELVGVPTAGYVWAPAQMPEFLTRAGEASGPTIAAQNQPGYAGGNHWEVLMFAATAPGTGELVLEQRRPWETDQPAVDTFSVTIVAR